MLCRNRPSIYAQNNRYMISDSFENDFKTSKIYLSQKVEIQLKFSQNFVLRKCFHQTQFEYLTPGNFFER